MIVNAIFIVIVVIIIMMMLQNCVNISKLVNENDLSTKPRKLIK